MCLGPPSTFNTNVSKKYHSSTNERIWTGLTNADNLPTGWGHVIGRDMTVWSHFMNGLPHYVPNETVNPNVDEEVSYLGDGLWFKGEIIMGQPIVGEVKTETNYHFKGTFHSNGKPKQGTMYYYTSVGEPNGFWEGFFAFNGDRYGFGKMTYGLHQPFTIGCSVNAFWNNDEIQDGNCKIEFKDICLSKNDFQLHHGYVLAWLTDFEWSIISKSPVSELFHSSLHKQRQVYVKEMNLSNQRQIQVLERKSRKKRELVESINRRDTNDENGSKTSHDSSKCQRCRKSGPCRKRLKAVS